MFKKLILAVCLALLVVTFISAQENKAEFEPGKWGITVQDPLLGSAYVGLIFHVTPNIAIAPQFLVDFESSKYEDTLGSQTWEYKGDTGLNPDFGANLAFFYVMSPVQNMALFLGPIITFAMGKYEESGDFLTVDEDNLISFGGGASLGAQYMFTKVFGVFGYLNLVYTYEKYTYKNTTVATGTVNQDDVETYTGIDTSTSSLGVVLYLK